MIYMPWAMWQYANAQGWGKNNVKPKKRLSNKKNKNRGGGVHFSIKRCGFWIRRYDMCFYTKLKTFLMHKDLNVLFHGFLCVGLK